MLKLLLVREIIKTAKNKHMAVCLKLMKMANEFLFYQKIKMRPKIKGETLSLRTYTGYYHHVRHALKKPLFLNNRPIFSGAFSWQ